MPKPPLKPRIVEARFVASAPRTDLLPAPTGVEVAFAGRSNVGKSTLLNALMDRKGLARTSSTPGCTHEVVLFEAKTDDGALLTLVDLPGYGYAKRSKAERLAWATLAEDYLLERASLAGVAVLVDVRRGLEQEERDLLELLASPPRTSRRELQVLLVATKLDKLGPAARKPALARLSKEAKRPVVGFSATDRSTHEELYLRIRKLAGLGAPGYGTEPLASTP
jgi:GTP-binding protein